MAARRIIQGLALVLCLLSLRQAWAGVWVAAGHEALEKGLWGRAFMNARQAERLGTLDKRVFEDAGQSALRMGIQYRSRSLLRVSRGYFMQLNRELPYWGRAWIYRALGETIMESLSPDGVSFGEWKKIEPLWIKGYRQEKGSAWVAFEVGTHLLAYRRYLVPPKQKWAAALLKKSLLISPPRRIAQTPHYLGAALEFLWGEFHDASLLESVTPQDVYSRRALSEFLRGHGK